MGKRAASLASSSVIAGLFLGIAIYTGVSVDPQDLMGMVAQAIVGQLAPQYSALIDLLLIILAIAGIWQLITMIVSGLKYGLKGLAMTISGFIGGTVLIYVPIVGIILIIISYIIGNYQ